MKTFYLDGHRKTNIDALPEEAWTFLTGAGKDDELKVVKADVPWLYRGMQIIGQSIASVPFSIYRGENELTTSEDWDDPTGLFPYPKKLLMQVGMSLVLYNKAYAELAQNKFGFENGLFYMHPLSVEPEIDKDEGLVHFKRKLREEATPRIMDVDQVVYWWGVDPHTEIGPPDASPGMAALQAAQVLANTDKFAAAFFERGAVKATILAVPQGTLEREKTRLEKWWNRLATGVSNAFTSKVLNADAVSVETIGEGIEGLENTALTKEKREDISTALGIPQSKLFSSSATDSNREMDERSFLKDTVVPWHEFIAEELNRQVLDDLGYRWVPRPDKLDEFQEDETQRAESFSFYVGTLGREKAPLVGEMLGLDLPEGFDYDDLAPEEDGEDEETPQSPQEISREIAQERREGQREENLRNAPTLQGDLEKWRRKALNRVKDGSGACEFVSEAIPGHMNGAIEGALEETETKEDVHKVFDTMWREYI